MVSGTGSGETARALIRMGATDAEAAEFVRLLHPGAQTTTETVRKYRWEMRDVLEDVTMSSEAPGLDRAWLRRLILGVDGHAGQSTETSVPPPAASHVETTRRELLAWKTNQQVLDAVLAAHPDCGYTGRNVSDRRSRMRDDNEYVPDEHAARRWHAGRPRSTDPKPPEDLQLQS